MMTRITAMSALALLAACGSASVAERDAAAQTGAAAKPLTIAGLRIGMSAPEGQATLVRDGWNVRTSAGEDWAATVDRETKRQRNVFPIEEPKNGIEALNARKGDEALIVEFQPTPGGDVVKSVKYAAPAAGRTPVQIAAEMTKRYGGPGSSRVGSPTYEGNWCSGGDPCRTVLGNRHANLQAKLDDYGKLNLTLLQGIEADEAWQASIKRAAGSRGPAKSSF
ncbi:hypothetical protein [Sphingomonas sp. RIT328]|uniref:hypothetical protein n=1 Tax=Sphingomonas sp. RIT328 TaxID=1470591 RepID=UPI001267ADDC|nr:hypothetical protein [Sphingomonas sp. RIT328]